MSGDSLSPAPLPMEIQKKPNTHLRLWAQSPFLPPVYQWRLLFYQNAFKYEKVWGCVRLAGQKQICQREREALLFQHLLGRDMYSDARDWEPVGIKTPGLQSIQLIMKRFTKKKSTKSIKVRKCGHLISLTSQHWLKLCPQNLYLISWCIVN